MFTLRNFTKLILFILIFALPAFAQERAGIILSVSGDVWLENNGQTHTVAVKTIVYQDDIIVTGDNGRVQVLFRDDTIMSLSPDTELDLVDYQFGEQGNSFAVNILKGVARVVTGEIVKRNPDSFNISTPHSSISIRGTTVTTLVLPSGTSAIVNNATAGFPVSMRSLATNEIEYTDATGIVLHTDLHGAVNMREATPEEMRLSQLVSPSMAVEVEEQGIGGRDLLNARVANEDLSDRISAATTPVATFSGNLVNDTIANGVGGGTIDFTVNMETGAVNDLIVDFTTPTNTIEITQTGEITLDGLGGFRSDNYSINPGLSITNQTGLTYSGVTNVVVNGNNIRSGIPNVNVLLNNGGYLEDRLNDTGLNRR